MVVARHVCDIAYYSGCGSVMRTTTAIHRAVVHSLTPLSIYPSPGLPMSCGMELCGATFCGCTHGRQGEQGAPSRLNEAPRAARAMRGPKCSTMARCWVREAAAQRKVKAPPVARRFPRFDCDPHDWHFRLCKIFRQSHDLYVAKIILISVWMSVCPKELCKCAH